MSSDPQLRRWYLDINRRYFDSALPEDTVIFWEAVAAGYGDCWKPDEDGEFVIRINPALRGWPQLAKLTLFHECVHVKLHPNGEHGSLFDAEIVRLAQYKSYRKLL
jgi:hypothetical protein